MLRTRTSALVAVLCLACGSGDANQSPSTDTSAAPAAESAAGGSSSESLASLAARPRAPEGWEGLTLPEWIGSPHPTLHYTSPDGERSLSYSNAGGARLADQLVEGTAGLVMEIVVSRNLGLATGYRLAESGGLASSYEVWDLERGRVLRRVNRDDVESVHAAGDTLVFVRASRARGQLRVQAEVHGQSSTHRFDLPSRRVVMVSDDAERVLLVVDGLHAVVDRRGSVLARCDSSTSRAAISPGGSHLACVSGEAVEVVDLSTDTRRQSELSFRGNPGIAAVDDRGRVAVLDLSELVVLDGSVRRMGAPSGLPTSHARLRLEGHVAWLDSAATPRRWNLETGRLDPARELAPTGQPELRLLDAPHLERVHLGPAWVTRWDLSSGRCEAAEPDEQLPPHLAHLQGHPALERLKERFEGHRVVDVSQDGSRVFLSSPEGSTLVDPNGRVLWSGEANPCAPLGLRASVFLPGEATFVTCVGSLAYGDLRDDQGEVLARLPVSSPRSTSARGIYLGDDGWLGRIGPPTESPQRPVATAAPSASSPPTPTARRSSRPSSDGNGRASLATRWPICRRHAPHRSRATSAGWWCFPTVGLWSRSANGRSGSSPRTDGSDARGVARRARRSDSHIEVSNDKTIDGRGADVTIGVAGSSCRPGAGNVILNNLKLRDGQAT